MDDTRIGRAVYALARYVALAGGIVLVVVTATTVISVIGRSLLWTRLGFRPIPGDYELVEAGVLFAVFSFLPWCHLTRAHAIVAVLSDRFSVRANVVIEAIMDLLMLGVALFIAWRHCLGILDKFAYRETTLLLRMPLWWVYAAGMIGAVVFVIAAAYCLVRSSAAAAARHPRMPESGFSE